MAASKLLAAVFCDRQLVGQSHGKITVAN